MSLSSPIQDRVLAGSHSWDEIVANIESGLAIDAFDMATSQFGWSDETARKHLRIPARTLARRRQSGKLSRDESERVYRYLRLFALAVDLFAGDEAGARQWLNRPAPALGRKTPVGAAETEVGAREVEHLIGRLEHGVVT